MKASGHPGIAVTPSVSEGIDQISNLFEPFTGQTLNPGITAQQTFVPTVDNLSALELQLQDLDETLSEITVSVYQGTPGAGILLVSSNTSTLTQGDATIPVEPT